jgi:hypothetical protein
MCYQNSQLLLRCFVFIIFFIHRVLKVAPLSFHSLLIFFKGSGSGCTFVFYWQPFANNLPVIPEGIAPLVKCSLKSCSGRLPLAIKKICQVLQSSSVDQKVRDTLL